MDTLIWVLALKPLVGLIWAAMFIGAVIGFKWIVWTLLPEGRLKTALFRFRGQYDPKAPPGSGKVLLDDPTVRGGSFREDLSRPGRVSKDIRQ